MENSSLCQAPLELVNLQAQHLRGYPQEQIFRCDHDRRYVSRFCVLKHPGAHSFAEIAVQVLVAFYGGGVFQVTRIHGREWGISVGLGLVSIPLGFLTRCVPTPPLERVFVKLGIGSEDEILPTVGHHQVLMVPSMYPLLDLNTSSLRSEPMKLLSLLFENRSGSLSGVWERRSRFYTPLYTKRELGLPLILPSLKRHQPDVFKGGGIDRCEKTFHAF